MNVGTAPTATDIFTADSVNALRLNAPDSMKRFKIMSDNLYKLSANGQRQAIIKIFKPLNHHIRYTGTLDNDASQGPGSLWLYIVSDEATNTPTATVRARFRYIDN